VSHVHVVIELVQRAAQLKIEPVIVPGPPTVQRIFDICQLTQRLPFISNG
jgi:anti-anti-sigma regulatory factor